MLLAARYVLPVAAPHIVDGAILVRGDRIVEIGEFEKLAAAHPDEEVRDFGLAVLMPGFVDLHTHLEYSAMRGLVDDLPYSEWKLQLLEKEQLLDQGDWEDSALLGAAEALRSGITTIADITETGASARAAASVGLRATIYREVSTMEKRLVGEVMTRAAEDIAKWREYGDPSRLTIGIAPHATYSCHPELYRRVAEKAVAEGLRVSMHVAVSRDEYDFVKYGSSRLAVDYRDTYSGTDLGWLPTGVSPVLYLNQWGLFDVPNLLAVHCTQVDDSDMEILAEHDVAVAYCPRCNAKLGMGVAPLGMMLQRGIRVGIGTDSPASNNTLDMFDEMRIGLLIQRSVSGYERHLIAREYIKMATMNAARALGIGEIVGSLEPGKQADIIAVDISHSHQIPTLYPYSTLVHTTNQENVVFTMVAGQVLYDTGCWSLLDMNRIQARAEEMRVKLRA
ncbi:MAG: amidohydrolase family protein [Coriobacteriia bacterium]|jgi:5-methylthioadenosine/S-adenosylhomocysteine deaminase|nr:amidohydrolase family protein [Coriobacteriia bacterium]